MTKGKFLAAGLILLIFPTAGIAQAVPPLYTDNQAAQGRDVYAQQCATCHGDALEGLVGPALKGTGFRQMATAQNLNAQTLLDTVSQTMPQTDPGSLNPEQYAAIVAFILQQNGYPAGTDALSAGNAHLKNLNLGK